jgi:hypothetical protein
MALHLSGVASDLKRSERFAWAFVIGFGFLGWVLFFLGWAGLFQKESLAAVLVAGTLGIGTLRGDIGSMRVVRFGWIDWFLLGAILFIASFDVLEALAPPADADSLAYHYALPKDFIAGGALHFVPRALDGAVPLLVQLTYVPALALGGERAMTLWCMLTGWAAGWLFFVVLVRYVQPRIAVAGGLVLMGTPTILAGAGTGQVEPRMIMFTLVAAMATIDYVRIGRTRMAALAGAMAGFYAAGKYLGLLFVAAAGLTMLIRRRGWPGLIAFAGGAAIAGFQWYLWNWVHTADPVFPMLTGKFGFGDPSLWPPDFDAWFKAMAMAGESPVPRNPLWFFFFPIYEIFVGFGEFGGGRVGLGPFCALVFPFAVVAAWSGRKRVLDSPVLIFGLLALFFYGAWFFANPSLRIRHLLPVYPILLVAVIIAADRFAKQFQAYSLLAGAFGIAIFVQAGGQALFGANYLRFILTDETREAFLARNVSRFAPISWINANLGAKDRIFTDERQLAYLIDVPSFIGHLYDDSRIDLRPGKLSPDQLMDSLQRYNITHVLVRGVPSAEKAAGFAAQAPWDGMVRQSCMELMRDFDVAAIASRTMNVAAANESSAVFRLNRECR